MQKCFYNYTEGTPANPYDVIVYQYNASTWKDLLTSYDGSNITYDANANPTRYYNGTRFTWEQGRQLKSATLSTGKVITYQYNENGIRIGKKVRNHQTTYLVDASGTVLALEYDYQKLIFAYDSTGRREGFSFYEGNSLVGHYYYLYNAQGDVTGILNQNMYLVVSYTYDSWGKLTACEGDAAEVLGTLNPFRYRGYIYIT